MTGNPKMQQQMQNANSWEDLERQFDFLAFSRFIEKPLDGTKKHNSFLTLMGSALYRVVRIFLYKCWEYFCTRICSGQL